MAQMIKNMLQCRRPGFDSWVRKVPWRKELQPTPVFLQSEVVQRLKHLPAMQETWV